MRGVLDGAVSEALGTVLMIAVVIALAAVVYLWVGVGDHAAPPPAMSLSPDEGATPTDRSFTLTALSTPLHWSDVSVRLDGAALGYDSALATPDTFCVVADGSGCIPTGSWAPATTRVAPGSHLVIHSSSLAGKTLLVSAPDANAAILQVHLG